MLFFFFNDTATTEIYTLSLHDALPIYVVREPRTATGLGDGGVERLVEVRPAADPRRAALELREVVRRVAQRSEEHTSELQSRQYLVCRLLLEKKKTYYRKRTRSENTQR